MFVVLDLGRTLKLWTLSPGLEEKHAKIPWADFVESCTERFRRVVNKNKASCHWDDIALSLAFHLKAGLNLPQAVRAVSQEGNSPSHISLNRAYRSYEAGNPMLHALRSAAGNHQEFGLIVDVLEMGAVSGGALPTLLCHVSDSIRNRRAFRSEARTKLIEARISAVILSLIPWIIVVFSWRYDPDAMGYLFRAGPGRFLLTFSCISWIIGNAMIALMIQSATPQSLRGGI